MSRKIAPLALLVSISIAVAATACGNTSTTKTEKVDGVEWNVTVNKVLEFKDSISGINTENKYTVVDTAAVNSALKNIPHCGNVTIGWTIPSNDGSIWLVAYENAPILTEKVSLTEANSIPEYNGNIQVGFKFSDYKKWAEITRENIGQRLAVLVNGQLMNAPTVNTEITSGNCSVAIPEDMVQKFLPNLDLEKLKQ